MYFGKITEELEKLISEYEEIFGYDPRDDEMYEIGDRGYKAFIVVLKKCIKTKKEIYDYWVVDDDDDD